MFSDDIYHSESEFYYPDDLNSLENEPISASTSYKNIENVNNDEIASDIQDFILSKRPENTVKKTRYDMNGWGRYFESENEQRNIENIPPEELNVYVCRFLMQAKKKDGTAYEPNTLTCFVRSLQRYLNDQNSLINIYKDQAFNKAREVLSAKRKEVVRENAKGNRPQAARELTADEEDELFRIGEFGYGNPEALQRTVWWLLSLHFGFRARDESRRLKWGDVKLCGDEANGGEFLVWQSERGSKTRDGNGQQRAFSPVAEASNGERCPVRVYKEFTKHRPDEMIVPEAPFFLAINHQRRPENPVWYRRAPLGKNEISKFLSKAAKNAHIEGNITNHSVRKTCISRLMDADIPANFVAQLSGHRNLKSLDSYKTASRVHQRKMSNVLSRSSTSYQQNNDDVPVRNHIESQSSSSTISYHATKFNATAPVHSQDTGLFSGASIGKFEGCTFNIQYVKSDKDCSNSQPTTSKRRRIMISDDSDSD